MRGGGRGGTCVCVCDRGGGRWGYVCAGGGGKGKGCVCLEYRALGVGSTGQPSLTTLQIQWRRHLGSAGTACPRASGGPPSGRTGPVG